MKATSYHTIQCSLDILQDVIAKYVIPIHVIRDTFSQQLMMH